MNAVLSVLVLSHRVNESRVTQSTRQQPLYRAGVAISSGEEEGRATQLRFNRK